MISCKVIVETEVKILDHGYLKLVESWGSDERIVEAARMSTAKGFLGWETKHTAECDEAFIGLESAMRLCQCPKGDEKLLRYLYENHHATPFEMAGFIIEVQAPIFVFREWHRHRTQSYNEMSARYTPLPDINYVPTIERLMINAGGSNKQAGTVAGAKELTETSAKNFRSELQRSYAASQDLYEQALTAGIPKELARVHLPVGRYSRMRASANLRNWLGFLTLRMAPGAQWEIRQYANAVAELVKQQFPRTYELFAES